MAGAAARSSLESTSADGRERLVPPSKKSSCTETPGSFQVVPSYSRKPPATGSLHAAPAIPIKADFIASLGADLSVGILHAQHFFLDICKAFKNMK